MESHCSERIANALRERQRGAGCRESRPGTKDSGTLCRDRQIEHLCRLAEKNMDGKGRALDNIFIERLWRSVKHEEENLNDYDNPRAARQGLGGYLHFTITSDCIRLWNTKLLLKSTEPPLFKKQKRDDIC